MKKRMLNGKYIDFTIEEITQMQQAQLEHENTIEPLTQEKKLELMLASIPTQDTPSVEPKVGYKEKATNKDLYSFEGNAGKGNYTEF